jgi:hypothetical protein
MRIHKWVQKDRGYRRLEQAHANAHSKKYVRLGQSPQPRRCFLPSSTPEGLVASGKNATFIVPQDLHQLEIGERSCCYRRLAPCLEACEVVCTWRSAPGQGTESQNVRHRYVLMIRRNLLAWCGREWASTGFLHLPCAALS